MIDFADLLTQYMRRIRTNDSGVAAEIGLTRQTIKAWKEGTASPSKQNRDKVTDCAQFLRLTEEETNGFLEAAGFTKEFVISEDLTDVIFVDFIRELFAQLAQTHPPVMLLLTQANWGEPPLREALLTQAKKIYSANNVLHIWPPYSLSDNCNHYFAELGKQCQFNGIKDATDFTLALQNRIGKYKPLFLLISRFEQGFHPHRKHFASILRSQIESPDNHNHLHVILCGGQKLEEMKYLEGDSSLLNIAAIQKWPEFGLSEVEAFSKYRWQGLTLDQQLIAQFLAVSGKHPQLLNECFQLHQKYPTLPPEEYVQKLSQCDFIWQVFTPFLQNSTKQQEIATWLQKPNLGKVQPFLLDPLKRELYWKNLLVEQKINGEKQLSWRCEAIRRAGQQILTGTA